MLFELNGIANYDVHPDGQRFALIQRDDPSTPTRTIHVVLNWFEELKRLVSVGSN